MCVCICSQDCTSFLSIKNVTEEGEQVLGVSTLACRGPACLLLVRKLVSFVASLIKRNTGES